MFPPFAANLSGRDLVSTCALTALVKPSGVAYLVSWETPMIWFILVSVAAIVGISVIAGRAISKPRGKQLSNHEKMTALKASGAMQHRKSNRNN
jgi:peptidoglycan/LPS O-acetylase OafA/YrhL